MLSYFKLLKIFTVFNSSNLLDNSVTTRYSNTKNYGLRQNKKEYSVFYEFNTLYRVLNVITSIVQKKGTIILVGSSVEIQKFYYFFNCRVQHTIFLSKWLNGFLTNWTQISSFINKFDTNQLIAIKKSKRLRFLRFFINTRFKNKPDLVLFFNYSNQNDAIVIQECLFQNIPVVALGSFFKSDFFFIPYKLSINTHNFYSQWFFFFIF